MGMYTELVLGVELSRETPKEVIDVLKYMMGEHYENLLHKEILENHPFFWREIQGKQGSFQTLLVSWNALQLYKLRKIWYIKRNFITN